jgi:hypothetical protein
MKKKFKVYVPLDYIQGYLRNGERVYEIEAESQEEALKLAKDSDDYNNECTDYSIEDTGDADWEEAQIIEQKEETKDE